MSIKVPPQGGYVAFACPNVLHKEFSPSYDNALKDEAPLAIKHRMQQGINFEEKVKEAFKAAILTDLRNQPHNKIIEIEAAIPTSEVRARREVATLNAMRNPGDATIIWNPRLKGVTETKNRLPRVGEPDWLMRIGTSENGLPIWIPGDVKFHSTFEGQSRAKEWWCSTLSHPEFEHATTMSHKPGHPKLKPSMQLCHYARLLDDLGFGPTVSYDKPYWAATIGKEGVLIWRDLTSPDSTKARGKKSPMQHYDEAYKHKIEVIRNALADGPAPTICWCSDCREGQWRTVNRAELEAMDDLRLTHGISTSNVHKLWNVGITTRTQFVNTEPEDYGDKNLAKANYWAKAREKGEPIVFDEEGFYIPRGFIEIDFDIENDNDNVYLIGAADGGLGRKTTTFRQFEIWSINPEEEARNFIDFWTWFTDRIARAKSSKKSCWSYHWAQHEWNVFKKIAERHEGFPGMPTVEDITEVFNNHIIDMHAVLSNSVALPCENLSLKTVANWAGFTWRMEGEDGATSMIWREIALAEDCEYARTIIKDYNEDDVMAQKHVREWFSEISLTPHPATV